MSSDELRHELETSIEAAQDVQHQSTVQDGLAKIGKRIRHALHLATVFVDGEGVLAESAELGVEEHGAGLAVVEELLFDAEPRRPSSDAITLVDDVEEVRGDGVEDP